jgi:antitoxin (DNA-binding transcriptional repressor) of toxin-antitoxin stability system
MEGAKTTLFEVRIMATVNLDDAKAHLREIIAGLNPGEELMIVHQGEPVATLVRARPNRWPCKAGSAKDTRHWMATDFDAPLEDFREYSQ